MTICKNYNSLDVDCISTGKVNWEFGFRRDIADIFPRNGSLRANFCHRLFEAIPQTFTQTILDRNNFGSLLDQSEL